MSTFQEKGWHKDVSGEQIDAAQSILNTANKTQHPIYYTERPGFRAVRYFWIDKGPLHKAHHIACFDIHGNFIIYPDFLTQGK